MMTTSLKSYAKDKTPTYVFEILTNLREPKLVGFKDSKVFWCYCLKHIHVDYTECKKYKMGRNKNAHVQITVGPPIKPEISK